MVFRPRRHVAAPALMLAAAVVTLAGADSPPPAPLPPPGEMARCHRLIAEGHFDEARARLAPIVEAHPAWQRATFLLGLAYHEESRHGEARPLLERALAIDASSEDAEVVRLFLGWSLYYLGDADGARRHFETFAAARPREADVHYALGLLAFDADDAEGAAARFTTAIELARRAQDARTEGKARARLADVHVRLGRLAEAKRELEAAVRLRPDAYEAYYKLSRVLERLGDEDGAARALERHRAVRDQVRAQERGM
jgi:tetratricopeptide (TPR) repeat protein